MFDFITDEENGITHISGHGRKLCGVPDGSYKPSQRPAPEQYGVTCADCQDAIKEIAIDLAGFPSTDDEE